MSEWISVKDQLPVSDKLVLFYYNEEYHIGYYIERIFGTNDYIWYSNTDNCVHNITHWMPLPEVPTYFVEKEVEILPIIPPQLPQILLDTYWRLDET